MLKNLKIKMY